MIALATMLVLCRGMISVKDLLVPRQLRYEKMHIRLAMDPIFFLNIDDMGVMAKYYPGTVTLRRVESSPFWRTEWKMFIDDVRICHKKDNRVDFCNRGENMESNWIVRRRENDTFVFKTQTSDGWYCMTYEDRGIPGVFRIRIPGEFHMSLCMEDNPRQKFIIREALKSYPRKFDPGLEPGLSVGSPGSFETNWERREERNWEGHRRGNLDLRSPWKGWDES